MQIRSFCTRSFWLCTLRIGAHPLQKKGLLILQHMGQLICHFKAAQHNLEYSKEQNIRESKTYSKTQELSAYSLAKR